MVHVGIDLGTSNTLVAVTGADGVPEIRAILGERMVPSVVYIDEAGGRRTIGALALQEWASPDHDPAASFRRWKLRMGESATLRDMSFGGERGSVTSITPELLTSWLVEDVLAELAGGVGGEVIESVLVTVPHGWRRENPEKCRATREAAGRAVVNGQAITVQKVTLSEPVAAAVYWLWAAGQRPEHRAEEFAGRTVLVCDIGGGTFDLSLVRVGGPGEPLVVENAMNHDFAGDYVTALLMAHVARTANAEQGSALPETAEGMFTLLMTSKEAWPREWFMKAEELQQDMSQRMAQAESRGRPAKAMSEDFECADGTGVRIALTPEAFHEVLEPFWQHGLDLTRRFLEQSTGGQSPHAVVFAGGGSRIAGVRERILRRALLDAIGDAAAAEEVLDRIALNDQKVDQAIALGAALVANGIVTVEERLICDVGIESSLHPDLVRLLGLPEETGNVILTPVLPRGSKLPAVFRASDAGLPPWIAAAGETLEINVVIDDDPSDPWVQPWEVKHPSDGRSDHLSVVIEADSDGVLSITLQPQTGPREGDETTVKGTVTRRRVGRGVLTFVPQGEPRAVGATRVSPDRLRAAFEAARRGE